VAQTTNDMARLCSTVQTAQCGQSGVIWLSSRAHNAARGCVEGAAKLMLSVRYVIPTEVVLGVAVVYLFLFYDAFSVSRPYSVDGGMKNE
jgi:hypothetical protein